MDGVGDGFEGRVTAPFLQPPAGSGMNGGAQEVARHD